MNNREIAEKIAPPERFYGSLWGEAREAFIRALYEKDEETTRLRIYVDEIIQRAGEKLLELDQAKRDLEAERTIVVCRLHGTAPAVCLHCASSGKQDESK